MKKVTLFAVFIGVLLIFAQSSSAQELEIVTPEKNALLLEVSKGLGFDDYSVKLQLGETNFADGFYQLLDKEKDLTAEQRAALRPQADEAVKRLLDGLQEFVKTETESKSVWRESVAQVLNAQFTLVELRELAAFLKTPTGRKTGRTLLGLQSKLSKNNDAAFKARFNEVVKKLFTDELNKLSEQIKLAKAK